MRGRRFGNDRSMGIRLKIGSHCIGPFSNGFVNTIRYIASAGVSPVILLYFHGSTPVGCIAVLVVNGADCFCHRTPVDASLNEARRLQLLRQKARGLKASEGVPQIRVSTCKMGGPCEAVCC